MSRASIATASSMAGCLRRVITTSRRALRKRVLKRAARGKIADGRTKVSDSYRSA